ncbi:MAG TPA: helix-turn-helix domain-containing protein [bacterium]|nr:helix-turn-helix domain-containing protein [bacterium]
MRRSKLQDDIQRALAMASDLRGLRVKDIARAVGRQRSSVSRAVKTLEARGRVVRESGLVRVRAAGAAEVRGAMAASLQRVAQDLVRLNEFHGRFVRGIELAARGTKAATAYVRALGEMAKARQQWVSTLMPVLRAADQIAASVRVLQGGLARTTNTLRPLFDGMQRWAIATREVHRALVPRGWLIPPELPMSLWPRLHQILAEKGIDAAEAALIEVVEEIACGPFGAIYDHPAFAARRRLLEMAREAHLRKEYALAIPVFLAQADGIAIDVFGDELYKPRTRRRVRDDLPAEFDFSLTFWTVVMDVLSRSVGLKRPVRPGTCTRHVVLHGRSLDYDTLENSAKAILLLCYLRFVVEGEEKARAQASAG